MTNAFEIRRASPAYPPKSGCGVPPQAVREASRLPFFLFISAFQFSELLSRHSNTTPDQLLPLS
jgi:hypothetical protein